MQNFNKVSISGEAEQFLAGLISEAGMDVLPPESRRKILDDLAIRLDTKLTLAALEALPADKFVELKRLLSRKKSPAQISDFLNKNVPNVGEVYALALSDFKKLYLGK